MSTGGGMLYSVWVDYSVIVAFSVEKIRLRKAK